MLLYPTETIYALGVNALDDAELAGLFALKGRDERQTVSWLVRNLDDILYYAELSPTARRVAERFLPGQLTLVLPAKSTVPASRAASDQTVGFRISSDLIAQNIIADFMEKYNAPLTCTSANISGLPTQATPEAILKQFSDKAAVIDTVYDDGPRDGIASTVVRIIGDNIDLLREGSIPFHAILAVAHS